MNPAARIKTFTDRYPFIGPTMWMLSLQYYVIQVVVALAWTSHYSQLQNTISDLGNTACGTYAGRFVCSPLHSLMNSSFITLGVFMALGSLLIYQEFKKTGATLAGFSFMAVGGIGTLLVGLSPENTNYPLHLLGAALPFLVGNVGIVVLGLELTIPRWLRRYMLATGIISLIALVFFATGHYLGIGIGGMERLTAYPQTLWLIVFGIYISRNHILKHSRRG